MEFVTQLWAYKSERFVLGVRCAEFVKNHVWLLLILLKTAIVGCSLAHLMNPDVFSSWFEGVGVNAVSQSSQASFEAAENSYSSLFWA